MVDRGGRVVGVARGVRCGDGAARPCDGRGAVVAGCCPSGRRGAHVSLDAAVEHWTTHRVEHLQQPEPRRVLRDLDGRDAHLRLQRHGHRARTVRLFAGELHRQHPCPRARALRLAHGDLSVHDRQRELHLSGDEPERGVRDPHGAQLLLAREPVIHGGANPSASPSRFGPSSGS